jgi:predicted negative regulator of RcsB-dependent stress response
MYRIGAIRVGQYSAWQSLQNGRARASSFAGYQSLMSTMSDTMFGAQLTKNSGVANLVVQSALARLQAAQSSQNTTGLNQAGSTLSQSTSSTSSPGSILDTVA